MNILKLCFQALVRFPFNTFHTQRLTWPKEGVPFPGWQNFVQRVQLFQHYEIRSQETIPFMCVSATSILSILVLPPSGLICRDGEARASSVSVGRRRSGALNWTVQATVSFIPKAIVPVPNQPTSYVLCVSVYASMYTYMHSYVFICTYTYNQVGIHARIYTYIVYRNIYRQKRCVYIYKHIQVDIHICILLCMFVSSVQTASDRVRTRRPDVPVARARFARNPPPCSAAGFQRPWPRYTLPPKKPE